MATGRKEFQSNRRGFCLALSLITLGATFSSGCNSIFGFHGGKPRSICVDDTGLLIDDMEDGDNWICSLTSRHGSWWTDSDRTSTDLTPGTNVNFTPTAIPPGERGTSQYAARFHGSGFTEWGALMGLNLNDQGEPKSFDATTLVGIKFSMKSNVPVSVRVAIPDTQLPKHGGNCVDTATTNNCGNHFAFQITAVGPGWVDYEVPFDALKQAGGGTATWDPRALLAIQFGVAPGAPFDVWIDDISFYHECATALCLPTCADPDFPMACPAGRQPASCVPAGTDCAAVIDSCGDPLLIDNMEDADDAICNSGGRQGWWWVNSDGSSTDLRPGPAMVFTQALIPGGRGASKVAARLTGSGFTAGALMGFNPKALAVTGYDASAFDGIKFWMKSNAPVSVEFGIPATIATSQDSSGTCDDSTAGSSCGNDFLLSIGGSGNEWREYEVPFSALTQPLGVNKNVDFARGNATWDPHQIKTIYFRPDPFDFDLWIDDIRLFNCGADGCLPTCTAEAPVACPASATRPAGCWPAGTDCALGTDLLIHRGVWASGPGDVWTVSVSNTTWAGALSHWDGSTWTDVATGATGAAPMIWSVWGSGPADVWAVGDGGTILHNSGSGWTVSASGGATARPLNAVWGRGVNDVWAVGTAGTVRRWNGSAWTTSSSGTSERLDAVWGRGADDVWAVGTGGTIIHWNGTRWSASPSGTTARLRGVWGSAANDVWAVGMGGVVVHWNGSVWTPVAIGTTHDILAVWGSAANDVWAVGLWGTIIHWDGVAWTSFPSGTFQRLNAVSGRAPNDVWAVGYANTILHWDGTTWSPSNR